MKTELRPTRPLYSALKLIVYPAPGRRTLPWITRFWRRSPVDETFVDARSVFGPASTLHWRLNAVMLNLVAPAMETLELSTCSRINAEVWREGFEVLCDGRVVKSAAKN